MPRAVIHADIDAFFASVELKRKPELKGKPVIVGGSGDPSKRGVVSAASYEARAHGVTSGMAMKTALRKCPEAVFLPVDFAAYEKESERFLAILRDYSPLVETFGLDEAFIEVMGQGEGEREKDPFSYAPKMAAEIKKRAKRETGLIVSVGVGTNKLLAKMACDMGKPDGFFIIKEGEAEALFRDMPVRKLWGVGPRMEKRLKDLGIRTIGGLAKTQVSYLVRNFGPNYGRTLHEHARGVDNSPVVPFQEPQSMSREVTFEEDSSDLYLIKETLYALTEDVASRLKGEGYKGRTVAIKVRFSDFRAVTREVTFEAVTDSLNDIWAAASKLLESVDLPKSIRLVGVKVGDLKGK